MKNKKMKWLAVLLSIMIFTVTGCTSNKKPQEDSDNVARTNTEDTGENTGETTTDEPNPSEPSIIDENGFWIDIRALDHIELCAYTGITVSKDIHEISDSSVDDEINLILEDYKINNSITDRAVADGDTVNIDYVGSVDGVEFQGGNTEGSGTDVTIGVTSYIDDFLEQLIGHMPGDSFDINVTFPEDYGNEELNGKDAVFATTINHILETSYPELTDDFVAETLSPDYTWTTVAEMRAEIHENLQRTAITEYVQGYVGDNSVVNSLPQELVAHQEELMIDFYQDYADSYGISLEEFVASYVGYETIDELKADYLDVNTDTAEFQLILQAIAEDAGISVTADDVSAYFLKYNNLEDYSEYEEFYGMPYLMQVVLFQHVLDYVTDNAVLE